MDAVAQGTHPQSPAKRKTGLGRLVRTNALQIALVVVLLLIWAFFAWRSPQTWLAYDIYNALMTSTPYFALMAIPLTLVVISKEIDLSFISIMALGMTAFDVVYVRAGPVLGTEVTVWVSFAACLLAGLLAGWLNGMIVVRLGIPSLVTTIGTQFLFRGVVLLVTNGQGLGLVPVSGTPLYTVLVGRIGDLIPMQFVWMIVFAIVVWFFLNRHRFGAHVYLTGDNEDSARLMGVSTGRIKIQAFAIAGLAAAFAGCVQSVALKYFWPTMGGEGYLLNTLAAIFLGGTSVFGGSGTIFGTFVASFIIYIITPGIVAAGWLAYWTQVIYGGIIVISIALQAILRKRLS